MNQLLLLILAAIASLYGCASAPDSRPVNEERDAVLDTVQTFFFAMEAHDAKIAERAVLPDGVFVSSRIEDGKRVEKHFSNREWMDGLGAKEAAEQEQFIGAPIVLIEGDVAVVWSSYNFYIDGVLHHTGYDAFNLLRTEAGWRISGGAYSVVLPSPPAR